MQVLVSPPHCRRSYARIVSPRRLTPSLFPLKQSLGTFYLGIRDYTPCHKETGGGGYEWPRSVSDARDLPQTPQRNCSGQSATRRGIVSGMFSAAQACLCPQQARSLSGKQSEPQMRTKRQLPWRQRRLCAAFSRVSFLGRFSIRGVSQARGSESCLGRSSAGRGQPAWGRNPRPGVKRGEGRPRWAVCAGVGGERPRHLGEDTHPSPR